MPGTLYKTIPKASHAVVEVATGTVIKTVLQLATPSTTNIRVVAWGLSFDGVAVADPAGQVTLIDVNVAATVTDDSAPEKWANADAQNSLCVGGVALTGSNATAEGTITNSVVLDAQEVHPQTGYSIWLPERPLVKASRFLRIRTLFSVTINCIPWIIFEEPA